MPIQAKSTGVSQLYKLTNSGRSHVDHGFSVSSLLAKRLKEHSSGLALAYYVVTPFMWSFQAKLEPYSRPEVPDEELPSPAEVKQMMKESALETLQKYGLVLARASIEASFASLLIRQASHFTGSVVYAWDMAPRLHEKYLGDLLEKVYLPRVFASLIGAPMTPEDKKYFLQEITPIAAFEDTLKRQSIGVAAGIVLEVASEIVLSEKKTPTVILKVVIKTLGSSAFHGIIRLAAEAVGAALGRRSGGALGEYWGGFVVGILADVAINIIKRKVNQATPEADARKETPRTTDKHHAKKS